MLVLTRLVGESITIGENITVTVLGVKGDRVKVGVQAPRTMRVVRDELTEHVSSGASEALDEPA